MSRIFKNFALSLKTNIKTIITAVILSVVVWFAISIQIFPDVTETITDIPVIIQPPAYMIENNLQLAEEYEFTANVQIRGKRREIGRLNSGDFTAYLNLANVTEEGEHTVGVLISTNSNFDIEISPNTQVMRIRVERIDSITLELAPNTSLIRNLLVEGMQIDESGLTANPPEITIRGEKTIIDSIARAEVIVVHNEEIFSTFSVAGELRLYNNNDVWIVNPDVIIDSENIIVTVPVHKVKTLELNMVIVGAPSNFDLTGLASKMLITPSELTLSSPDNSIAHRSHFDVGEILLSEIDMQLLNNQFRDTIAPKLPEGYKNISGNASFTLEFTGVSDYTQHSFTVPRDNITILNEPEGFEIEILTRELTVNVIGPTAYVQAMSVEDINVTLNLLSFPDVTDSLIDSRSVQCGIRGMRVPAWVAGNPQVDVSFTRIEQ
ncbi:MAG: CdaR family protein [Oscillospiraceae bacterium]|nr:CdaR family protein [Oscillospiraceae bacterium]